VITVSAISYLNTIPFVYGLENHPIRRDIALQFNTPAESARRLMDGSADIGIIPVAKIPFVENNLILPDWCIGAESRVASVLLCSGTPLQDIKKIVLDSESETSVLLVKILASKYWKISPEFVKEDLSQMPIDPTGSFLLIGDKALKLSSNFKYVYDLALEWVEYTSLPFVFACWTANKKLDRDFVSGFCDALAYGVLNIEKAAESYPNGFERGYIIKYLNENVSYNLNGNKKAGLNEFWRLAMAEHMSKVRWFY